MRKLTIISTILIIFLFIFGCNDLKFYHEVDYSKASKLFNRNLDVYDYYYRNILRFNNYYNFEQRVSIYSKSDKIILSSMLYKPNLEMLNSINFKLFRMSSNNYLELKKIKSYRKVIDSSGLNNIILLNEFKKIKLNKKDILVCLAEYKYHKVVKIDTIKFYILADTLIGHYLREG